MTDFRDQPFFVEDLAKIGTVRSKNHFAVERPNVKSMKGEECISAAIAKAFSAPKPHPTRHMFEDFLSFSSTNIFGAGMRRLPGLPSFIRFSR